MNIQSSNDTSLSQAPLLELDLLRTLVAISDTGSFSAAAEIVHRTPSAVSMQVKRMEELLGRPVFIRDSRSVRLTLDGELLLEHGRRVLALNREILSRFITPTIVGEVRLGAPDDVAERFLTDMLRRFADTHPGVVVNVMVDHSVRLLEEVRKRRLDLSIITCESGLDGSDGAEILYRERLAWAMLSGGVAAEQSPLPISVWEDWCIWRRAGIEGLESQGRPYRVAFQSAHISGQKAAILADLAVAPIPVSSLGGKIIEAKPRLNLPKLPEYALGMVMADNPSTPVEAAADHLRAGFAQR
ncbi:MAG: LysR family transcriptional regulator [Hyphomicrobiales bacterium]